MEISTSERKMEVVLTKAPFLLKAGLPLFLPIAAFFSAKILSRRRSATSAAAISPSSYPPSSESTEQQKDEKSRINEDEEAAIEELYRREIELELRFILYEGHKERGSRLLSINHKLCLEKTRLQSLAREVVLMSDEAERMVEMVKGYLKLMKEMEGLRWARGSGQRKVKKLSRSLREKSRAVREQRLVLRAKDEEMSRNRVEMDRKEGVIRELRDEIGLLRFAVDQLEQDKLELSDKIQSAKQTLPPETGEEFVSKEDNDYVVKELLRVEAELTTLRWDNACLRHDLIRLRQENKNDDQRGDNFKPETKELHHKGNDGGSCEVMQHLDWKVQGHDNNSNASTSSSEITPYHHEHSKRKRLLRKLRRWVDGGKSDHDKEKHHDKGPDEPCLPRRNSFSSV